MEIIGTTLIMVFENANVLEWVKHQVTHLIFFIKKNINVRMKDEQVSKLGICKWFNKMKQ